MDVLLKTPLGRDFLIMTEVGVGFRVHAVMLVGGPKVLENAAFPVC